MKMIKEVLGIVCVVGSILGGIYIGGWLMFLQPIFEVAAAIDGGTVTAMLIAITVIKCLLASFVATVVMYIGVLIGALIIES